mmetsp:Transcript_19779/g.33370  ORF Transcript_19779/g.33370 Transcript_19779/m.33370 type:complete len:101 (-) Transcript_19779:838-1140(-)
MISITGACQAAAPWLNHTEVTNQNPNWLHNWEPWLAAGSMCVRSGNFDHVFNDCGDKGDDKDANKYNTPREACLGALLQLYLLFFVFGDKKQKRERHNLQ